MSSWDRDPTTGNLTPIGGYIPFTHVGQIIESTTLDTEAKMQQVYGSHTRWISHSGYILRGATSNVTADDNTNTGSGFGGSDTHELTIAEMPSHTHTQNAHNHSVTSSGAHSHTSQPYANTYNGGSSGYALTTAGAYAATITSTGSAHTHTIDNKTATNQNTGGGTANVKGAAHSVTQRYKNIYIWERVS